MTERLDILEKKVDLIESTMSRLSESTIRLEGKFDVIGVRFDNVEKCFESSANTLTDKIDASTKLNETNFRAAIAEAKLSIILAIPAIIGVGTAIYKAVAYFSHTPP